MSKIQFLFMRHGETEANIKGLCSGAKSQTPLTPLGVEQAQLAALLLKKKGFIPDVAICSPTPRSLDTAKAVQDVLGRSFKIDVSEYFQERDYGAWENRRFEDVKEALSKGEIGEGGENMQAFLDRVKKGLKSLSQYDAQHIVLIVSHGGAWQTIYDLCAREAPWIENGDIYRLELNSETLKDLQETYIQGKAIAA